MATITIDPNTSIQTISGWECVAEAGREDFSDWDDYKTDLLDQAIADGLNRFKINMQMATERADPAPGPAVNDNADAFDINASGFQWTRINLWADVCEMARTRLQALGEQPFIILGYVDFENSGFLHRDAPEEYAELVEAAFLHLNSTYGWVPNAIEVILEPDHSAHSGGWTGAKIANCILAAQGRLDGYGWNPKFIAPSTLACYNAEGYYTGMKTAQPTVVDYIDEVGFHIYGACTAPELASLKAEVEGDGKRLSMLEFIQADYLTLHSLLKDANLTAFEQFALAYDNTDDGSHYYVVNHTTHAVTISTRLRYLRQYFKWVRRGAVRKGSSTSDANFDGLAFVNTRGNYVVVVKCAASGSFTIGGLPAGTYHLRYTTAAATMTDPGDQTISGGQDISTSIPAVGVLTVFADPPNTSIPLLKRAQLNRMGGELYG